MNKHGVSIEIDGIYCPECNDIHPTLYWHEKYDDYIDEAEYIEKLIKGRERFGAMISKKGAQKEFARHLKALGIDKTKMFCKCVICSEKTSFKNSKTNNYVCSNECRYTDNKEN